MEKAPSGCQWVRNEKGIKALLLLFMEEKALSVITLNYRLLILLPSDHIITISLFSMCYVSILE